jgi:hypothetical protein
MRRLVELAYLTVREALSEYHGINGTVSERARLQCAARGLAGADYLFGKQRDYRGRDSVDVASAQKSARKWFVQEEPIRELVIKSLRVINLLDRRRETSAGLIGEGLLKAYGSHTVEALDARAYATVVHRAIAVLPAHVQQQILFRWGMAQAHR